MQALLEHFITQSTVYSLIAVVLVAFLESLALVGLILPGTVLMAGLGALIGSGELSFWHAWLAGIVGCLLGDWEKIDANLAKAIMSIGAVKGFEIGDGFDAAKATGLTNNDAFIMRDGAVSKETNHSGGTLGGMTDGSPLIFRAAIKPTPSIAATQHTVNKSGEDIEISIKGRHDPIIVPRAVVVVEAMAAITIADALLINMGARMDRITDFYKKL